MSQAQPAPTVRQMKFSSETLACLRNCILMDKGTYEGKTFVRCIPFGTYADRLLSGLLPPDAAQQQALRVVAEIEEPGVLYSWHEKFGHYVRVDVASETYRLICHMKS